MPGGSTQFRAANRTEHHSTPIPGADGVTGGAVDAAAPSPLRVLDLFSGIGGFSLGLERTGGFETVAFCEIEEFPRKVLAKHWPGVPCYPDVRELSGAQLRADGVAVDVICGGFPCQDLSTAGKQAGITEGTRSGLWSEIARLVDELRPSYLIVENVANLLAGPSERPGGWFGRVLGDLASLGYDAEWENIPAAAVGAPHRRERVWLVAHPPKNGNQERCQPYCGADTAGSPRPRLPHQLCAVGGSGQAQVSHTNQIDEQGPQSSFTDTQGWQGSFTRPFGPLFASLGGEWEVEPGVGRVAHGVPDGAHRLGALGNAVVPAIPELIGRAILAAQLPDPKDDATSDPIDPLARPVLGSFHALENDRG